MKNDIDKKALILVNIIAFITLIIMLIIKFTLSVVLFYIMFVFWLIFIIYSNYNIIIKNTDITSSIKAANRRHVFDCQTNELITAYKSVKLRENFFTESGKNVQDTYELIRQQIFSNIKSAVQYMSAYDYAISPEPKYLNDLCEQNEKLLSSLSELVELIIKIDSTVDDTDLTEVECIIESLRGVLNDK